MSAILDTNIHFGRSMTSCRTMQSCLICHDDFPLPSPQNSTLQITTSIRSDILLLSSPLNTTLSGLAPHSPCQFYMLLYHRDRMLSAASAFAWLQAVKALEGPKGLLRLKEALHAYLGNKYGDREYPEPLKLRVLLSQTGALTLSSTPTPPAPLPSLFPTFLPQTPTTPPSFTLFLPPCRTSPSPYTTHKTTFRPYYDHVRAHLPASQPSSLSAAAASAAAGGERPLPSEILLVNTDGAVMEASITTPYFQRQGLWVTPRADEGGNVGTTRRWALEMGLCGEAVEEADAVRVGEVVWLSNGVRGWGWASVERLPKTPDAS